MRLVIQVVMVERTGGLRADQAVAGIANQIVPTPDLPGPRQIDLYLIVLYAWPASGKLHCT